MTQVTLTHFPTETKDKVAGIKAIRGFSGASLKDAKAIIEDLMNGELVVVNLTNHPDTKEKWLPAFASYGGKYMIDNDVEDSIHAAAQIALDKRNYPAVIELVQAILNNKERED